MKHAVKIHVVIVCESEEEAVHMQECMEDLLLRASSLTNRHTMVASCIEQVSPGQAIKPMKCESTSN